MTMNSQAADLERQGQTSGAARWLGYAASPVFAAMAAISSGDAQHMPLCGQGVETLPIGGMTAMYLLMSLFHLSPWLGLAAGRRGPRT